MEAEDFFRGQGAAFRGAFGDATSGAKTGIDALRRLGTNAKGNFIKRSVSDAWVRADDSINVAALQFLRAAYPGIADVIEQHMVPWAKGIQDGWPVRTGVSKAALNLSLEVVPGSHVRARFAGGAIYTAMIRRKRNGALVWRSEAIGTHRKVAELMAGRFKLGGQ